MTEFDKDIANIHALYRRSQECATEEGELERERKNVQKATAAKLDELATQLAQLPWWLATDYEFRQK